MPRHAIELDTQLALENEAMYRIGGPTYALRAIEAALDDVVARHPALDLQIICEGGVTLLRDHRVWTIAATVAGSVITFGSSTPRRLGILAEQALSDLQDWANALLA